MKKIIAVMSMLMLVFVLAACGGKSEPVSPAQQLLGEFQKQVKADSSASALDVADVLITSKSIEAFNNATMQVEPGYLSGFSEEITGFSEGAMFGPVISSIPFIGYVFRVEDGTDTKEFVQHLKDTSDLRWNICTEADEMVCEAVGDMVFFVMSPAEIAAE